MSFVYKTKGVCSREMSFDVEDNKLKNLKIEGGCTGNLSGIISLTDGMDIDEIIKKLKGIQCRGNTSCPDQLSIALSKYKAKESETK